MNKRHVLHIIICRKFPSLLLSFDTMITSKLNLAMFFKKNHSHKRAQNAVTPNSVVFFCDYQHGQILAMYWILKEELKKQKMLTEKLCHTAPTWLTHITTCKYVIHTWKLISEN